MGLYLVLVKISSIFLVIRAISSREFISSRFRAISSSFTIFEPSIFEQKSVKTARNCRFRALFEEP